jgi:hypothetical protein
VNFRQPGDRIEGVFRVGTEPFIVMPLTVVADGPERIAHYIARGTQYLIRRLPDGSRVPRVVTAGDLQDLRSRLTLAEWRADMLVVTDPDFAHSIRHLWAPGTWTFEGWYVNLQRPLMRTATGFTTEDHFLDVVVQPDLTWSWKDEDELVLAVERGRLSHDDAAAIRHEGERVVGRIEARRFPFDGSLIDWRPDPAWPVPVLGDDWKAGK